jgi:hypothetical protein
MCFDLAAEVEEGVDQVAVDGEGACVGSAALLPCVRLVSAQDETKLGGGGNVPEKRSRGHPARGVSIGPNSSRFSTKSDRLARSLPAACAQCV